MKKRYLVLGLFLLGILISSSLVSAGWFDWLFDRDTNLVGQAYRYTVPVKEQVKCVFKDSTTTQVCSSSKGKCEGMGSCVVTVSGKKGEQVTWKSTCGGYAYTIMDGQNDVAEFKCTQDVRETVKCILYGDYDSTNEKPMCYSEKGSCTAIPEVCACQEGQICPPCEKKASCTVEVSGKKGEQVTWKSTCGGYAYTIMDGQNDVAEFKCTQDVKETVKCVFYNVNSPQECYSDKGSCKAEEINKDSSGNTYSACYVEVAGKKGEQVTWKSTCGGYAYTIIDGQNEADEFKCQICKTCSDLGKKCGEWDNGCGKIINCGKCEEGYVCKDGTCVLNSKKCWSNEDCTDASNSKKQFCDFPGCAIETGTCFDIPSACPFIIEPVCGCDGKTYQNKCLAAANAVSVKHTGECENEKTYYRASWDCYDGYEVSAANKKPLTSGIWNSFAEEDCKGKCNSDGKCGVAGFAVS